MRVFGINLDKLIIEAVDEINPLSLEKQRQELKADELKPFKAGNKKKDSEEDVDEAEDEGGDDEKGVSKVSKKEKEKSPAAQVEEVPEISAAKIVKILNRMRSGKSLSDKAVRVDFQKYYNSLDGDERLAFYTFLDSVQKIVADDEEFEVDEDAITPDDAGVDVDVDVKKKKKKKKKVPAEEKGTSGAPIVVGEQADKSRIRMLLRRNR